MWLFSGHDEGWWAHINFASPGLKWGRPDFLFTHSSPKCPSPTSNFVKQQWRIQSACNLEPYFCGPLNFISCSPHASLWFSSMRRIASGPSLPRGGECASQATPAVTNENYSLPMVPLDNSTGPFSIDPITSSSEEEILTVPQKERTSYFSRLLKRKWTNFEQLEILKLISHFI